MATTRNVLAEAEERKNLAVMIQNTKQNLDYLEDRKREIEQKDLELTNETRIGYFNENLLAQKDQQLIDKESIIAEKSKKISTLEEELADVEVKLKNRNAFLVSEHKQEMKMKELKIQQLESQIKQASELRTEQGDDKNTQTDELEYNMSVKGEPTNAKFGPKQYFEGKLETAMNEHELSVNNDVDLNILQARVGEQENFVALLQKQLELVEDELKKNAVQVENMESKLRKTEKELLISKQLANETMIREIRQLQKAELSDELKEILSSLKEDTAKIVKELHQTQRSSTHRCSTEITVMETMEGEETSEDSSDHLCRLRTIYSQLIGRFDAKKMVGWMFQQRAIGPSELQSILSCKTAYEAAEGLLEIILNERSKSIFDCFLMALNHTNQQHISSWISCSDYDIDSEHVQLIQRHHMYLVDNIDSLHSSLLDELYTREVIDQRDMEQLRAEQTQTSCNEKLLSMLGCKSAQQFEQFLSSLTASGQDFVVKKLMGLSQSTVTQTRDNVDNPGIFMK